MVDIIIIISVMIIYVIYAILSCLILLIIYAAAGCLILLITFCLFIKEIYYIEFKKSDNN